MKRVVGAWMHNGEDRPCEEVHVRTRENMNNNSRSVSALYLSPHDMLFLFVQLTRSTKFSYCFFLPDKYLKSIVANKILC